MQVTKEVLDKYGKREPDDDEDEDQNESFTMNGTFNAKSNLMEQSHENFDDDEDHITTVVDGLHGTSPGVGIDDNSGLFD